jgi:membrane protein implicated in regulation of membrane protease activity
VKAAASVLALALAAVEYGILPEWIAGIGTAIATIVAAVAINREVQRRREEQAAEFSHQARRVLCWLAVVEAPEHEGRTMPRMAGRSTNATLGIIIRNGSEEPVVDCHAQIEVDPAVLAQRPDIERQRLTVEEPIIPPGDMQRAVYLPTRWRTSARVRMAFTDANGTRWLRGANWKLSRIVDPLEGTGVTPRVGCGVLWHGQRDQRERPGHAIPPPELLPPEPASASRTSPLSTGVDSRST